MSTENKPTTRRRPVSVPKRTKAEVEALNATKTNTPQVEDLPTMTPEESVETTEEQVVTQQPVEKSDDEKTVEEWEAEIKAAREAKEAQAAAAKNEDAIEAEVQRRVREQLRQQEAANAAKNPLLTKDEQAAAVEAANAKSVEELQQEIAEKNNASDYLYLSLGNDDDFTAAFTREIEEDGRPDSEKTSDPTPYATGLVLDRRLGQKNNAQRLYQRFIADLLAKNNENLQEIGKTLKTIKIARVTPKIGDGSAGPKKLTGASAKAAVVSRMKGMYRVHLYNSGFWIDLRKPSLIDIDSWMQEVDGEFKELGRVMGGHAHSVLDIYLKQKLMEILPGMIQRSNFEGWQDANALVSNISFHDYDVILWAFCCMMYKDGVGVGIYCTNPDCRYIDDNQYVDLRNICFINTEVFNPEAITWMQHGASAGSGMKTAADLEKYRNEIVHIKREMSFDDGKTVYELRVPTMREFIEEGTELISKLTALVNGQRDTTTDVVSNQLTYHLYRMLTPWIKTLKINDDEGNLVYLVEDRAAIYESLDVEHFEESDMYKEVSDYIRDTKIAFFSSTTLQCPKCGKKSSPLRDNMTALDMEYIFFCLSCLMLEQTGASL